MYACDAYIHSHYNCIICLVCASLSVWPSSLLKGMLGTWVWNHRRVSCYPHAYLRINCNLYAPDSPCWPVMFIFPTFDDIYIYNLCSWKFVPITIAAPSKAWTVVARSNTGIVGLNPTQGTDICVRLFCVCVLLFFLRGADPPTKETYRLCIELRNWKSGQGPTKGL
jgi:hypothetical protein